MEGEKKRKRAAANGGEVGSGSRRRKEREAKAEAEAEATPPPTDEEVDEFFAILRRMQVAVKYFEKGRGGDGAAARRLTGRWATALEAEVLAGVKAAAVEESVVCGGVRNNGAALDLNAVPEAETSTSL